MKKTIVLLPLLFVLSTSYSQNPIDLTYTAIDGADYTQLDSIKVMNRTQGSDTVLYYPDTVLSLLVTGLHELPDSKSSFQLSQNYPNPFTDQTSIKLQLPESGNVNLIVTDILGRTLISINQELKQGLHSFMFTPGNDEVYFLTARFENYSKSIKMLCSPFRTNNNISLDYLGYNESVSSLKTVKSLQSFIFNYGDELLYIGYYDTLQSGMLDSPVESNTYTFQFAYDIPCPGTPTIEYDGQIYNTVQIMSQCWLKENLNVGTLIPGSESMTDNDTIEKYCYHNEPDSCAKYGGLYEWDEIMQYNMQQGTQGICPPGWHIPTDEEWKVLEGTVDLYISIGHQVWEETSYRGFDAGKKLKTKNGWYDSGNGSDFFGFVGLPGGFRSAINTFSSIGGGGSWWSSSLRDNSSAYGRYLYYGSDQVSRGFSDEQAYSVRCIKD